jgi:diacylglycerol kinase family enzyme
MPFLKSKRVIVLLNSRSGTTAGLEGNALQERLDAAFREHGIAATLEFLSGSELPEAAKRALDTAEAGEIDAIVVGGGDGTIRTVAGLTAGRNVSLGVIPLGTFNHFAKDLGIPLEIEDAIATIASAEIRFVDVGEVNEIVFINNSSIGLYPELVLTRDAQIRQRGRPKWLAMSIAAVRASIKMRVRRLKFRTEDGEKTYRSPCVFIGNNRYNLKGSDFGSRERLDGGQLHLCVAKQEGAFALLRLFMRCITGAVDPQRDLESVIVTSVQINSRHKRLLIAFDGEVQTVPTPLNYRIRPKDLRVFAPPAAGHR